MELKLTAPVGQKPRPGWSKGADVKNAKPDVKLVQAMLTEYGYPVKATGKVDAGLLKAIEAFQKGPMSHKNPDQVIDPGSDSFKKLAGKYRKYLDKLDKTKMVKLKVGTREHVVTEPEFEQVRRKALSRLKRMAVLYRNVHNANVETIDHFRDVATLQEGYFAAAVQLINMKVHGIEWPADKYFKNSLTELGKLDAAVMRGDMTTIAEQMPKTEKAVNAYDDAVYRFTRKYFTGADVTVSTLQFTSATCFAIVGALGAPALVAAYSMSAGTATIVTGTGVAALESMAKELGAQASGTKKTALQSAATVLLDSSIGALTAGIGNKIKMKYLDDVAKRLAGPLHKAAPFLTKQQAQKFLIKYFMDAGRETVKTAVASALKLAGESAKSGKLPTEKQINDELEALLRTALTTGLLKHMGDYNRMWAHKHRDLVGKKLAPDVLKSMKGVKLTKKQQSDVLAGVVDHVSGSILKMGYDKTAEKLKGDESAKQMMSMTETALLKDNDVKKLIRKAIEAELKNPKYKS